uniref:Reverse transcriptase zinc-binding domain-containing protein n=1 Tax=Oryza glumipatula TaxID=40148 RepID=A0A0D9ZTM7_9ORYZ
MPLSSSSPRFIFSARSKLTVAQALSNHRWVRGLRGSLSNVAMVQCFQLWDELQLSNLSQEPDTIRWKASSDGNFSVSSAYDLFFMARESCPYGELIWQAGAPSKIRFFLWLVAKGRMGWPHEDCCHLCGREHEDCHHLFVSCNFTNRVWRLMRAWINIVFPLPGQNDCNITDWWIEARRCFRTGYRKIFDSVFMLTCWLIWKERNARIFDQKMCSPDQLVEDIKEEIMVWKTTAVFKDCNSTANL